MNPLQTTWEQVTGETSFPKNRLIVSVYDRQARGDIDRLFLRSFVHRILADQIKTNN